MTHKFDVNQRQKLDNPKKRELLPPEKILPLAGVKESDVIADIGCGIGYFSIPAAILAGEHGLVYALDLEEKMLDEVRSNMESYGVMNIQPTICTEYDFRLKSDSTNFVLMSMVLHEVTDKIRFLNEARRILKEDGRIAILDWKVNHLEWGPPQDHRIGSLEVKDYLISFGYQDITVKELNEYFYLVTAVIK